MCCRATSRCDASAIILFNKIQQFMNKLMSKWKCLTVLRFCSPQVVLSVVDCVTQ